MNLSLNIKSTFSNTRGYFLLCLCSIAIGLSISKPLMSLGLFGLLIVWLVDGNLIEKIKAFYNNKIALIISSIYVLTLLGLIYTSNFDFAIDDLRRKLPLFFLPFYMAGFAPITKKELHFLLKVFIVGVLIATMWSLFVSLGGLQITIVEKRDLSRFNSHIRFGLEVALAIFFTFYFLFKSKNIKHKIWWLIVGCWLISSLFLFSLFSGLVVFIATTILLLFVSGITTVNRKLKIVLILVFITITTGGILFISSNVKDFYINNVTKEIKTIPLSKQGNKYRVDLKTKFGKLKENGYYIEKHIADKEFADAWNNRSSINYEALDLKGNSIKFTLRRFIASQGNRKDKEAIDELSKTEIKAIENGTPNVRYLDMNYFSIRIHQILWEYNSYIGDGSINGHSILMRWEYWKTAIKIIKNNPLIGVGTGDVQDEFDRQYILDNSNLFEKYRLRTHNQFLAFGVSFGLIGLSWFIICLFYPIIKTKRYKNYIYLAFFSIVMLSMITEDTLEVQAGINFFVFFNSLFLLSLTENKSPMSTKNK